MNLVSNAIKFTDFGKISVILSSTDIPEDQLEVKIEIIDTGIGISRSGKKDLFKKLNVTYKKPELRI